MVPTLLAVLLVCSVQGAWTQDQIIEEKPIVHVETVVQNVVQNVDEDSDGHLGCFRDNGARDLPHLAINGHNSPQLCKAACKRLGYQYAGVQYSAECWCGNSYGRYGRADNCNMKCTTNDGQICGGGWANNVYRTAPVQPTGRHLGCFRDRGARDLTHLAHSGNNSPQLCKAACQRLGFRFAGVQYSAECWCGNSYGKYGRADNCNMRCTVNDGQICGGGWANNVYEAVAGEEAFVGPDGALGCFRDNGARDLPHLAHSGNNSPQLCRAACQRLGYQYAGVQYSAECWCGNSYGKYGRANNCNMRCTVNDGQLCGGGWANYVYKVGV